VTILFAEALRSSLLRSESHTLQHPDKASVVCCENLLLSEHEESLLSALGEKVPKKFLGPPRDGEVWRIRYDRELYELSEEPRHYGSDEDSAAYVGTTCGQNDRQFNAKNQNGKKIRKA